MIAPRQFPQTHLGFEGGGGGGGGAALSSGKRRRDGTLIPPAPPSSSSSSSRSNRGDPDATATRLWMIAGSCYLPKTDEDKPEGEDAHFICRDKQTIGVADGVGGWASVGVDAGEYARELMSNAQLALHSESKDSVNPKRVLEDAYLHTHLRGSSTACIVALNGDRISFANVGDSGLMLFRNKKLVYRSQTQQKYFNCPYQLGVNNDAPDSAYCDQVRVEAGDVLVVATDGLLDNLYPYEIVDVMDEVEEIEGPSCCCPEKFAWSIAGKAWCNSVDEDYDSPFCAAAESAGEDYTGGKYDDITVVVAQIVST